MHRLSLAGTTLPYFHVCAFFNSRDEEYDVLLPFYREAIEGHEKVLNIVDPDLMGDHRARLAAGGIDAANCESCGQLEIVPWTTAFLDEAGEFDKDRMLATIDHLTGKGRDAGFERVRITGNMSWTFRHDIDSAKLIEYESEVNEVLARNRQPAICIYDVAQLDGAMMMDLLRTHPLTLVSGVVHENPYFMPPARMPGARRAQPAAA